MNHPKNRNISHNTKRKSRKIRPVPFLIAGLFIDAISLGATTFFLGTLAYFFQWKIEHFQTLATIVYLADIYLSSLIISFIAGHRYPLLPLANGFICLAFSLLLLAANHLSITENLLTKLGAVFIASLAAYLTVRLLNQAAAPKKTRQRIPIAQRSYATEKSASNSIELQ